MTNATPKIKPRMMQNLLAEVAACKTRMPWERGLRRAAFIARRNAAQATPARRATA